MMNEAASEPSETPQSPIRPMTSLGMATTPLTPPTQMVDTNSKTSASGVPPPSFLAAPPFVTLQNHIPIPNLNNTFPPLFPNIGGPGSFTPPPLPLFFPNTCGPSNTGHSLIFPLVHVINESQQTTLVTAPLTTQTTNGPPPLMHTSAILVNNATSGPSVSFQTQSYTPFVTEPCRHRHSHHTSNPPPLTRFPPRSSNITSTSHHHQTHNLQQHDGTAVPSNATAGIPFCSIDTGPRLPLAQCHFTVCERVAGMQDSQHRQTTPSQNIRRHYRPG